MGSRGAIVLGFFGALFAGLTLYWQWKMTGAVLALPLVVFALLAAAAAVVMSRPGTGLTPSARARRAIKWSTIGEGVGLCIVSNLVILSGRLELLLPAMALVVGLHFIPIAIAAPFRPFLVLGGVMILAAVAGLLVPGPLGGEVAGLVAAASLWVAAVTAIVRDLKARRASLATA